jgi:DNA processing protein
MSEGRRCRGRRAIFWLADYRARRDGVWPRNLGRAGKRGAADELWPKSVDQTGAKLVTGWEDVIEELPTSVRTELLPVETATSEQRDMLVEESLPPGELTFYDLLTPDESRHVDDLVERSGLTSSEVRAALFDLELKGVVGQLPGKQFLKVLL